MSMAEIWTSPLIEYWRLAVVYPYSGILLNNEKKWNTATSSKHDESQKHYAM